jgi:hypothetical protein
MENANEMNVIGEFIEVLEWEKVKHPTPNKELC